MMREPELMGGGFPLVFMLIIAALSILEIYLKGKGMWRAARNGQSNWFIALLLINTMGILPAIYLYNNPEKKVTPKKTSK